MNEKLRFAIDNTNNPKILQILSKIAELKSDEAQGKLLDLIESGAFG